MKKKFYSSFVRAKVLREHSEKKYIYITNKYMFMSVTVTSGDVLKTI